MMTFYFAAATLLVLALLWILRPLLRGGASEAPVREAANLAILKAQLAELEVDRQASVLSDEHYERARAELERRVLDEAIPPEEVVNSAAARIDGKRMAVALALLISVGSVALYAGLGNPDAVTDEASVEPHLSPQQV